MAAAIHAIAVALPSLNRTNEYWRRNHPEMVADASNRPLARIFSEKAGSPRDDARALAMQPLAKDPFRGAVGRRWLADGETSLGLELEAARSALSAARLTPADIDLAIVSSFQPDQPGVGNAAFLAKELSLGGAAWNLETAC